MTALIIIGVILLIIVMILFLPVHVTAAVKDEAKVFLRILFVRIKLFPMKEKPKKKKKEQKPKQEKPKEKTEKKEKEKRDIPSLVRSVADILGVFLREFSKYKIIIGTDDAAKTALLYGAAEQATAYLFTILGENAKFTFSKKNSLVWADFTSDRTMADVKIDVSISVFGTLAMLVPTYIAYVRNFGAIKPTEIKPQTEDAPGKEE